MRRALLTLWYAALAALIAFGIWGQFHKGHDGKCSVPCTVNLPSGIAEDDVKFDYTRGQARVWIDRNH